MGVALRLLRDPREEGARGCEISSRGRKNLPSGGAGAFRMIMAWIRWFFGEGSDLETWQMAAQAVVTFFIALLLIRASGRRSFRQHTPFDACVTVPLGAALSRAVVGASPFWATVAIK
ncbi:hypothetical protein [Variovorax flavidus]|uniref:hypothetical protein n=1 Tax=Variovorax flavidus TaxID=3053501 RepID=UPI003365785E